MTACTTKVSDIGFVVVTAIVATKSLPSTVNAKVANIGYVLVTALGTVTARCGTWQRRIVLYLHVKVGLVCTRCKQNKKTKQNKRSVFTND